MLLVEYDLAGVVLTVLVTSILNGIVMIAVLKTEIKNIVRNADRLEAGVVRAHSRIDALQRIG